MTGWANQQKPDLSSKKNISRISRARYIHPFIPLIIKQASCSFDQIEKKKVKKETCPCLATAAVGCQDSSQWFVLMKYRLVTK